MTVEEFQSEVLPALRNADFAGDRFILAFFSKEEDTFNLTGNTDRMTAISVMVGICDHFDIDPEAFARAVGDKIAAGEFDKFKKDDEQTKDRR